ncbi:hypothetical protein N2152v2_006066 [Parachlorella kessleri]
MELEYWQEELIKQAEAFLKQASSQPGYGIAVLRAYKESYDLGESQAFSIPDGEKEQIKSLIVDLMLSAPPKVRSQLSEALSIISSHDFPAKWQTLLPLLIEKLKSEDQQLVNGVLSTADSIYHRYRNQFMTDQLSQELEYSQQLVAPLLATLQALSKRVAEAAGQAEPLRLLLSNVQLVASIFYSLNSPGLTEAFEETLDAWMAEWHTYLSLEAPALDESDPDRQSVLDSVKATVCECLILFMEKNEEEFAKFLQTFVQDVWTQLMKVSQRPGQDNLALHAINFLTAVSRSVHYQLFKDPTALRQICESIVIPNLKMRDDMEEMFDMNWIEYVRRDTEGSDSDTRRRAASELVKSLTERFPAEVTELFTGYVGAMLAEAALSPQHNWRAKDCAIYLVTALTVRGKTAAAGATTTNTLVNLQDFFKQHIAPELGASNPNDLPILKADALKFITTFRSQLPKDTTLALFPSLINLLGAESNVVHSYAAIAVEKVLSLKEGGKTKFTPEELAPFLQALLEKLFAAFHFPESGENEYLMKCVMRVITFVGKSIAPVAPVCLQQLAQMLLAVCKNPTQPGFNHYLFESVAALIRYGCEADPRSVTTYEEMLFPPFNVVLQEDVQEFHPYVFQIFAQLMEVRGPGDKLPDTYLLIFPPLLTPVFWERSGNIPALVRLLQAYLSKAGPEVVARGYLAGVLGVFQKLLSSKAHDHEGFYILNTLIEYLDMQALAQYLPQIWGLLFQRLQSSRTTKYVRSFLLFVALFTVKHGPAVVGESIDAVQPGLTTMILQQVWLPSMATISGAQEEKLVAVATVRLLTEAPALQQPAAAELWGHLLAALVQYVEGTAAGAGGESGLDDGEVDEYAGYSAAFARLHNAHRQEGGKQELALRSPEQDPVSDVRDAKAFLATSLASYSQQHPGKVPALVQAQVPPEGQQKLQAMLQAAGVGLV